MSLVLQFAAKHFQGLKRGARCSMQHDCNMWKQPHPNCCCPIQTVSNRYTFVGMTTLNSKQIDYIARELETHKRKWDAGSFPDLIKGFLLCAWNGHPLPDCGG
jgi:hypothetical protein